MLIPSRQSVIVFANGKHLRRRNEQIVSNPDQKMLKIFLI